MSVLLHIDSSPLGSASISRSLSAHYVEAWQKSNPEGKVITRDLNANPVPLIDANWIGSSYTPTDARSDEQKAVLALSNTLIGELREADEYIIGLPMHNFNIPSVLRLWIDQIARAGETFAYSSEGPVGLLKGKKATFIVASGGVYGPGSQMESFNFIEPYLRAAFGFIGVSDVRFHLAGGASAVAQGKVDREEFLKTHAANIQADFQVA
ncbi:FMN-dependent NADH-azoreductase [bacterium]|nr:MAG: FMN-dependent NADH-azoreductase [bacterium]